MTTLQNSAQNIKAELSRHRFLLLGVTLLFLVMMGSWLAQRLWWSVPVFSDNGEQLARQVTEALKGASGVQVAAGAYVPGDSLWLYSRIEETDREKVRLWALQQLQAFHQLLTPIAANERLQWVIDFGPAAMDQEIIVVPLNQVTDTTSYRYISSTADLVTNDAAATTPQTTATVAAVRASPNTVPVTAPLLDASTVAGQPAVIDSAEHAPTQPTLNQFAFDEPNAEAQFWSSLSGDWVMANGLYSQQRTTGFDYISMLTLEAQRHYQFEAQLRMVEGEMGGGFIYNAPAPDERRGAQMVDFVEQGSILRWGRYDEQGNYVYEGAVQVAPAMNDGQWHTLQLLTHATTSTVTLDGRILGQIVNTSPQGYLGLTTSQAHVEFDNVIITTLAAGEPISTTTAWLPETPTGAPPATIMTDRATAGNVFQDDFANGNGKPWRVLNGAWQFIDQSYQQRSLVGLDLGSISTFQGETYTVTVRLQRLAGAMGGGLYFNMAQRDDQKRSQMISYTRDGKAIQWGSFDEGGNYVLEQVVDVPTGSDGGDGAWHTITVAVQQGKATFRLDGTILAQAVPLTYTSGYVGLFVSNSQVAFDDFMIVTR